MTTWYSFSFGFVSKCCFKVSILQFFFKIDFSEYDVSFHDGARTIRDIVLNCWSNSFGNESVENPEVFLRQKRHFEESLEVEAKKIPEKSKGIFHSIAFSVATEKILSQFQVTW